MNLKQTQAHLTYVNACERAGIEGAKNDYHHDMPRTAPQDFSVMEAVRNNPNKVDTYLKAYTDSYNRKLAALKGEGGLDIRDLL